MLLCARTSLFGNESNHAAVVRSLNPIPSDERIQHTHPHPAAAPLAGGLVAPRVQDDPYLDLQAAPCPLVPLDELLAERA